MAHPLIDAKQLFTKLVDDKIEHEIRVILDDDPVLGRLPEKDRANAARSGASHALLAIRAQSIVDLS